MSVVSSRRPDHGSIAGDSVLCGSPAPARVVPRLPASLARGLREARTEAGLHQEQAAEVLGVDPSTLARYEQGRIDPADDILIRAAQLYGAPWLLALHPVVRQWIAATVAGRAEASR